MSILNNIPLVRSRIAMFLKSGAGNPSALALLEDAAEVLRQAEQALRYWRQRAEQAEQAEALNQAEQDDGK